MLRHYPFEPLLNPWIFLSVLMLGLLSFFFLDQWIAVQVEYFSKYDLYISYVIHRLFKGGIVLAAILVVNMIAIVYKRESKLLSYTLILLVLFVIENFFIFHAKNMLGRARPSLWIHEHIYGFFPFHRGHDYTSFPSGHTLNIMIIFAYLAMIFKPYRVFILSAAVFLSLSRVWGDYHFFSDWFVTGYLALTFIPLILYGVDKLPNYPFLKRIKQGSKLLQSQ
jgi:membrane-associated phospholipid phosphatase